MRSLAAAVTAALISMATASVPLADGAPPQTFTGRQAAWRWESFGGVEVRVPAGWGYADSNLRLVAWCITTPTAAKEPVVARPGRAVPAVGCFGGNGTLISNTGWVVGFARTTEPDGTDRAGDRTTVRRNGVEVAIQVPRGLRERIAATVRDAPVDEAGCPATHPVSLRPLMRPAPAADVSRLRDVTAVAACRYELQTGLPRLTSSLRLDGPAAAAAVRGIVQAPVGEGPDQPGFCEAGSDRGSEGIVLRVQSAAGRSEIMLRYDGCGHSGFDDGVTTRRLTAAAVAPFIAGPNQVLSFTEDKWPILMPR